MDISRRKFFRLGSASVGAIALGAVVLPESKAMNANAGLDRATMATQQAMRETMPIAGQRAIDPPLLVSDLIFFDGKMHVVRWIT